MKPSSVRCSVLGLVLAWLAASGFAAEVPTVKLVDMYAKAEGDGYKIYILANGDISQYKTSRKVLEDSYKLTVDIPALSPIDSKYDLSTPFSRRFEVWPMMLENQVYSRVAMELDLEAASVIGQEGPTRIFITISRNSPTAVATPLEPVKANHAPPVPSAAPVEAETADARPAVPATPEALPDGTESENSPPAEASKASETASPQTAPPGEGSTPPLASDGEGVKAEPARLGSALQTDQQEFFSLFPTPAGEQRPIFNVPTDLLQEGMPYEGIRLRRFLVRPIVYASWLRGTNLLLRTSEDFKDSAINIRARAALDLLESTNTLRLVYEVRYRDYRTFVLTEHFSHFIDFNTEVNLTPRMLLKLQDHLARGVTETGEFDRGREVGFSSDPFLRNQAGGSLQLDFSDRLGVEFGASYNRVHFLDEAVLFYDYDVARSAAAVLYHLSPVSTIFGQYERSVVPEPSTRPEARAVGDAVLLGMRGEITSLLVGTVRGGYQRETFGAPGTELSYRGLVADANLIRQFSDFAALTVEAGRVNNRSNFEENGYFTTNYVTARLITPLWRETRLNAAASLHDNRYPLPAAELGVPRKDQVITASAGLAYFFTRRSFFQVDFLHEERRSNLEWVRYRNNVIQVLFGFGFLSQ